MIIFLTYMKSGEELKQKLGLLGTLKHRSREEAKDDKGDGSGHSALCVQKGHKEANSLHS